MQSKHQTLRHNLGNLMTLNHKTQRMKNDHKLPEITMVQKALSQMDQ